MACMKYLLQCMPGWVCICQTPAETSAAGKHIDSFQTLHYAVSRLSLVLFIIALYMVLIQLNCSSQA